MFIPQEAQNLDDQIRDDNAHVSNNAPLVAVDQATDQVAGIEEPLSSVFPLDDENSSCEFMVDFKMDENFLSDFLNVDFSELYNNGNGEGGSVASATTCDKVPDFQSSSMVPVIDYDLDWLIDNTAH